MILKACSYLDEISFKNLRSLQIFFEKSLIGKIELKSVLLHLLICKGDDRF